MTLENSKRLIEHYKKLIENPELAFPPHARAKPRGKKSIIEYAKKHLADMEENLKIREYLKSNPGVRLNPLNILKKLQVPTEAIEKNIVEPKKENIKKTK